ncbi:hypothetical protein GN956_G20624 [Arapaima gigas]
MKCTVHGSLELNRDEQDGSLTSRCRLFGTYRAPSVSPALLIPGTLRGHQRTENCCPAVQRSSVQTLPPCWSPCVSSNISTGSIYLPSVFSSCCAY